MNAPVLWIFVPGFTAIILYPLRRWEKFTHLCGFILSIILAVLAWWMPIGEPISVGLRIGLPAIVIDESISAWGAQFTLDTTSRPFLIMIYLGVALWFGGAYTAGVNRSFIPLSLLIAAFMTAALTVNPGQFAPLMVEIAILLFIPIFCSSNESMQQGVLRFIAFQTLGMCFILLSDALLPLGGIDPTDSNTLLGNTFILVLGFALLLAVFPFHTWVPMLAQESHPYSIAFMFYLLPATVCTILFGYLERYMNQGISPLLTSTLQFTGLLAVVSGGIWAAFERNLGRIMGFAAIHQTGTALLALSMTSSGEQPLTSAGIFFSNLVPSALGLAVWALSLSIVRTQYEDLQFRTVQGLARRLPITSASIILSNFSLAGLPILASFPVYAALWSSLALESLAVTILPILGCTMLMIGGLRTLAVFVMPRNDQGQQWSERGLSVVLIAFGSLALFVVGLMPQWFFPFLTNLGQMMISPPP